MSHPVLLVVCVLALQPCAATQQKSAAERFAELRDKLVEGVTEQLRSDDLATIAWGAHAAAEYRLEPCVPDLRRELRDLQGVDPMLRQWAVSAILDALVQTNATVPGADLAPFLVEGHLGASIVLLSRSVDENRRFLLDAFRNASGDEWLACGNLLAAARDPEFALALLRTRVLFTVIVADIGDHPQKRHRVGDGGVHFRNANQPRSKPPNCPPTVSYALRTDSVPGAFLLTSGSPSLFVHRVTQPDSYVPLSGLVPASARPRSTRTIWLAQMLGPQAENPWFDFEVENLCEWTTANAFLAAVAARRREIETDYGTFVAQCVRMNLVSAEAAAELQPDVKIVVEDRRRDRQGGLPEVK